MSEPRRCPQCDAEIPVNSPAGLCPRCLLKASADSKSGVAEPGPTKLTPPASGFVPPTVEELAPLFPQLEILELLGKGGMGAVYKARQPGLDRLVALKILPPEISHDPAFAERFQREARALARLSHPHIVAVYDFGQTFVVPPLGGLKRAPSGATNTPPEGGTTNGLCYIVMEFVDGTNLRQTIRTGRLAAAEALAIVPQICEALQFAHDEGIVHRDIKPENILIDKRGRVKIADFGLAKLMANGERESPGESLTATHQVMGTLRYMAPEQMQGSREVDHRADIYSLGVVFYELLTGELPMGRFAPPSKKVQVDVRLDEVVLRALEQDPEQRYQHASDVKSDVDTINRTPSVARPESAKGVATPSQPATADQMAAAMAEEMERRKRLAAVPYIVGLGCILLAIGGVAVALFISENGDNPTQLVEWLLGSPFTFIFLFAGTFMLFMAWARYLRERKPSTGNTGTGSVSLHRQQDAKEILPLVMGGLYVMSIVGWALAIYGGARVISESAAAGSDRRDGLPFGCILVVSIVAQVVLHKAWKQGRDRLARIGALDLVTAGGLMSLVIPRWCGLPSWAGLIYSLVAFVGYLMLRGKDISAGLRDRANQSKMPQTDSSEPRLSRCALIGAIWAPLFFIAFLMTFVGSASYAPGEHTGPAWWQLALMFTLLPLGALAPFGTTILGAVAIAKIKRSDGKLYGLRLAQADALLFPLLLLAGVAGFVAMLIVLTAIQWGIDPRLFDKNDLPHLLIVVMAVPIWFFPARALWRAVVGPRDAFELGKLPVVGNELLTGQAALVIALAAITAHAWPWHWISSPPPSSRSMTISNFDVIDALQSLGLLVLSIGGALFASAATLARPAKLILRIGSVIAALVALVIQVQFFRSLGEYEPGHVEKVVRLTRTYSHMGVYVTIALTGLAILFFVLRFIEGMMAVAAPLVPLASGRPAESPTGDVRTHTPVEMSAQIPKQRTEPAAQQSLPYLLGWLVWWLLRERWFVTILQTATALVYFVCLIAFFSFQSSSTLTVAGSHTKFQVGRPTAWLTLESSQAGQNVRFEFITLTHFVALIGLASLVIYRWLEHRQSRKSHSMMWHYVIWIIFLAASVGSGLFTQAYRVNLPRNPTITASQSDLPPLGTITSGIGVEFIVPAGQVVTFEIVTRRDNETVPIPSHCAYLMAADKPVGGQFRWSPKAEENTAGRHRSWRIEIRTAGGGGGFSEATLLPDELNAVVGARGLTLGLLEPNEESIHWGTADVNNLPANGLIGLRVTVVAHGMKQQGSGTAHIDWKKAQPTQSTTRRKLPDVAP